eukprot:6411232-Ditylum_brightwellii.AAC.1
MAGPDKYKWKETVKEEYECMEKHTIFKPVPRTKLPKNTKVVTSTWVTKKKANVTYQARLNAHRYEQRDQEHYDGSSIVAPAANDMDIRIVLVLMLMAGWCGHIIDVKDTFLHGDFEDDEEIYMEVPQGFESYYPSWI